jgi:DNA-binding LacI/PurR family transcriptional regulator
MVTAKDVALALDVAISTVGRAMANDPRISHETKQRVRAAASRMGYVGNNPARIIRGGSSNLLGLVVPDIRNDFFSAIAQALSECMDEQGYRLVLSLSRDDREIEARQLRELVGARPAGIIIVPTETPKPESRALLATLPHAQFLRHVHSCGDIWFGIDDERAAHTATAHLLAAGHRRIGYIGGNERLSTGRDRLAGYLRALTEAGVASKPSLIVLGGTDLAFALDAAMKLMNSKRPPTAILAAGVHITVGTIQVADQLGVRVPDDLSIVGFGESAWLGWWRDGLTTISAPIHQMAITCGLWFIDHIRSPLANKANVVHRSLTTSNLIVRRSVGPPRSEARLYRGKR